MAIGAKGLALCSATTLWLRYEKEAEVRGAAARARSLYDFVLVL